MFHNLPAGPLGGWPVGKSDFNENPVVNPDLDLDFGLRLRVCQNNSLPPIFSSFSHLPLQLSIPILPSLLPLKSFSSLDFILPWGDQGLLQLSGGPGPRKLWRPLKPVQPFGSPNLCFL